MAAHSHDDEKYVGSHCFAGEVEDEILGTPLVQDRLVMFRVEGQKTNHCYDSITWGQAIRSEAEKGISIWQPEEDASASAMYRYSWPAANRKGWLPVLRVPRAQVFAQTNPNLLLRFNTFFLKYAGKQSYSTPFGTSALHAVNENFYVAYPINRAALEKGDFSLDTSRGYAFVPDAADVRNGQLGADTIVVVELNGAFSEVNKLTGEEYAHYGVTSNPPEEPVAPEEESDAEEIGVVEAKDAEEKEEGEISAESEDEEYTDLYNQLLKINHRVRRMPIVSSALSDWLDALNILMRLASGEGTITEDNVSIPADRIQEMAISRMDSRGRIGYITIDENAERQIERAIRNRISPIGVRFIVQGMDGEEGSISIPSMDRVWDVEVSQIGENAQITFDL
jgi:hypothetical protein